MATLAICMNEAGDSVLNRTGFSWMAAIFPPIWAFQRRLYKTCVAALVVGIVVSHVSALMPHGAPWIACRSDGPLSGPGAGFVANPVRRTLTNDNRLNSRPCAFLCAGDRKPRALWYLRFIGGHLREGEPAP